MMKTSIKILFQCFALSLVAGCATQVGKVPNNELNTLASAEIPAPEINEPRYSLISEKFKPAAVVQTGRYSFVPAIPTLPQREPLQVIITVTIPSDLQTVGEAVRYLLRRSGYGVESPPTLNPHAVRMFLNPLPDVQRSLGPMTLQDALTVLVTPELVPVIDPIRRRINYVQTAEPDNRNASTPIAANGE
ncbi:MAG: hypothetical protein CVV06_16060 [Gammaproteobacteria bacterium HGW-Gammaproteobacteria-10]|nr:MAG: hypothetical protein CVV06_16060 [Gammaproteobacteria bacterium HGW-Gammaproteobacteria-10]